MQEFFDTFLSSQAVGLAVAAIIFVITVILVARRLIGFVVTFVFLIFAIISGLLIANNELVREKLFHEKPVASAEKETNLRNIRQQIKDAFEVVMSTVCRKSEDVLKDQKEQPTDTKEKVGLKIDEVLKRLSQQQKDINEIKLSLENLQDYSDTASIDISGD